MSLCRAPYLQILIWVHREKVQHELYSQDYIDFSSDEDNDRDTDRSFSMCHTAFPFRSLSHLRSFEFTNIANLCNRDCAVFV
jgi:hypothetical protein